MLAKLADELRARGVATVEGSYRPTPKNGPARDFYANHGFATLRTDPDGSVVHQTPVTNLPGLPPWFEDVPVAGSAS